jgi:class 3 adenylate cyclase
MENGTNGSRSEIATVMIVDIGKYTKLVRGLRRGDVDGLHEVFDKICLQRFEKYSGKVVKKMGDAFLATFKSPTDSLLCAMELQNGFSKYNKENKTGRPLRIRVALHTGEVIVRNEDIYGDTVNIASRIEELAEIGQIYFSGSVFMAMNKNEVPFLHLGLKRLKGLGRPLRIFRVRGNFDEIMRRRRARILSGRRSVRMLWALVLLVLVGFGVWVLLKNVEIVREFFEELLGGF